MQPIRKRGNRGTALVTGASSGIGLELARRLARDGYDLVVAARGAERLRRVADELLELGAADVLPVAVDLAQPEGVERILSALGTTGREVDVLVNNAGFGGAGAFGETDATVELDMIQLNVVTLTHLTKALLPEMLARGSGRILNVSSTAGFQPGPFMAVYYATKAYVLSFSEAIAEELDGTGITVTALCPGPTDTGFADRAGMTSSALFRRGVVAEADTVADAGYEGMMAGTRVVVPGVVNKALVQSLRVSPRCVTTAITRRLNESRTPALRDG